MAYIAEQWDSGAGSMTLDSSSRELIYIIADAATIGEAVALALDDAPDSIEQPLGADVVLQSVDWEIEEGDMHRVTLGYGLTKPLDNETADFDFSFDTTGGSQKITQSFKTVNKYARPGTTAPDFKGAIGVNNDSVEGCEIPTSAFKWTETHYLPIEQATFAYADKLEALTGKRNAGLFRGKAAGTVIFEGAQGGKKDSKTAAITFHFKSGKHVTGLELGEITGIEKKAWDYLWVRYEDSEDANQLVKRPSAVYVEEVTYEADFAELGIGTA